MARLVPTQMGATRPIKVGSVSLVIASSKSPLDAALIRAGMSGTDLARKIKSSESQVSRWRNGLNCSEPSRKRIAKALDVDVEELWP